MLLRVALTSSYWLRLAALISFAIPCVYPLCWEHLWLYIAEIDLHVFVRVALTSYMWFRGCLHITWNTLSLYIYISLCLRACVFLLQEKCFWVVPSILTCDLECLWSMCVLLLQANETTFLCFWVALNSYICSRESVCASLCLGASLFLIQT